MIETTLKSTFGFNSFKPHQQEIVEAIVSGRAVFTVMPTGGGKSLCFQLPAVTMDGTCIVISPLIALMKDQVDAACENGIKAAFLNSSMSISEKNEVETLLFQDQLDLLYIAPERLAMGFMDSLKRVKIAFFAIDEAHCISEWGHDFRPDYLVLADLQKEFPGVPVSAFTASATEKVRKDIVNRLNLSNPLLIQASLDRPNLFYQVERKYDAEEAILNFIRKQKNESGIVYRGTRAKVDATALFLKNNGINAIPYHAGMDQNDRKLNQEAFNKDEVNVIVATIAFGMGIDKSNIRYIIHGEIPKNIESYYQETGRAGRDGDPAHCLLLYASADEGLQKYFISQAEEIEERKKRYSQLDAIVKFATSVNCRRKTVLNYFGEEYEKEKCGGCDVCEGVTEFSDATRDAQILLSAILRTDEKFGIHHNIDIIRGSQNQRIKKFGHDRLKTYGTGTHLSKKNALLLAEQLFAISAINRVPEEHDRVILTQKGHEILFGHKTFIMPKPIEEEKITWKKTGTSSNDNPYDTVLFEELRNARKKTADANSVPPFVVFSDRSLREMCRKFPIDRSAMLAINGVGANKYEQYGEEFIDLIIKHLEIFPEAPTQFNPSSKKVYNRPETKNAATVARYIETAKLAEKASSLEEVSKTVNLTPGTVVQHIVKAVNAGTDVSFEHLISTTRRDEVEEFFLINGMERLAPPFKHFKEEIPYDQLHLIRLFLM